MSISKIRSLFENKGCQVVTYVVMGLVAIGLLYSGSCMGLFSWLNPQAAAPGTNPVVVEIAGTPVTVNEIETAQQNYRQSQPGPMNPEAEFSLVNTIVDETVTQAATAALAVQRGVKFDDTLAKQVFDKQYDDIVASEKEQMVQDKTLKPGFTESDYIAAFKKKNGGKTPDQLKADNFAAFTQRLADPEQGAGLKKTVLTLALTDKYMADTKATVEDLKKSYEVFNIKQIAFDDPKKTPEQKESDAKKALAEIKGGLKFEDAQAKYAKGKPATTLPYNRAILEQIEAIKPLLDFKAGQVSDVIVQGGTAIIFKLESIETKLPPDFEKNQQMLLAQYQRQQAQTKLSKDVEEFKKSKLVWKDDVFKLAYDIFQEERGGQSGVEQHRERLKDLAAKVKAAVPKTGLAAMVQTLARYSAFEAYYATLPADQQKEAREERASVLKDVLEKNESNEVRLQLYDLYVDMGQFEEAGDALAEAANNNSGTDAASIRANAEIKDRLGKAEKAGKIEKAALDAVRKNLARWEKERIDEEKAQQEEQKSAKDVDKELEKLDDPAVKKAATTGGSAPKSESKK